MWKVIRYQVLWSYNFLPPDLYSTPKIVQQSTLYFEYGVLVFFFIEYENKNLTPEFHDCKSRF
jgi:hypothetical protein